MSVFAEFLFDGSSETAVTPQQQDDGAPTRDDDISAASASARVHSSSSTNGSTDNYLASSWSTEYGDLLEGMVIGLLEMQQETPSRQQQQQQGEETSTCTSTRDDEDSASYFDGRTIVSSAPSEVTMGADPISERQGRARVSRVPSYAALSLSTASSYFLSMDQEQDQDQEVASLASSAVSQSTELDTRRNDAPWSNRNNSLSFRTRIIPSVHQGMGNTMETVTTATARSRRLSRAPSTTMVASTPTRVLGSPDTLWYAQFNDADWDAFRQRVQMVQRSLVRPRMAAATRLTVRTLSLPPRLPALVWHGHDNNNNNNNNNNKNGMVEEEHFEMESHAEKALQCGFPSCFICPLCQDVLVGAISLECGCQTHVCAACWEYRCMAQAQKREPCNEPPQLALELDYVLVVAPPTLNKSPLCPGCYQEVGEHEFRGCHALDVAISQLVMIQQAQGHPRHPLANHPFSSVGESYRQRVEQWRDELVRRQVEGKDDHTLLHEEQHLAQLIAEEEAFWKGQEQWQQQQRRRRQCVVATTMPAWWGISVAVVAAVGMKLLLTHSIRAIWNGRP